MSNLEILSKSLARAWYYGDFVAETPNERTMQMLMEKEGLWPFEDEDDMLDKTNMPDWDHLDDKTREYFADKKKLEDKVGTFIAENGGSERAALEVALENLEAVKKELTEIYRNV